MKKSIVSVSIIVLIPILFLSVSFVHATITVSSNYYFGLPSQDTYINFATAQTFNTLLRANGYWYFNDYRFQVQNANMTINSFFVDNQLTFTLDAESGETSITKIYLGDLGEPQQILIDGTRSPINYNSGTKILTITVTHSSLASVVVDWSVESIVALESTLSTGYIAITIASLGIIITIALVILVTIQTQADPQIMIPFIVSAVGINIALLVILFVLQGFSTL